MRALIKKRVFDPLQSVLKQGLSRNELALTLAMGVVLATFPVFGVTTLLCMLVAAGLRLNQVVIQVANYIGYPLQFVLFIPLIRAGENILGLPPVSIHPEKVFDLLWSQPMNFLELYGVAIAAACLFWIMIAIPVIFLLKHLLLLFIPARLDADAA
ncbi:DUF2062 domain-containing protein [Parendozoicomonas haliclonae]|uniref:DUF2062 domain-containing protein n=1 Tax=Parendozoicomonas haliclonae TaxID=1960125 RepID=A0A1X7ANB2_9GAMM|nr:DUF2062 domain-containing protein [Parendozoicomonas haliclonae]SMA49633.1 hypothetical protein EHSB41UT_03415 [Parendozoicomonas haliclonae]